MTKRDPLLVISSLGGPFTEGDTTAAVSIVRLQDTLWSLEVITADGTSITWDELFVSDAKAKEAFLNAVAPEGLGGTIGR